MLTQRGLLLPWAVRGPCEAVRQLGTGSQGPQGQRRKAPERRHGAGPINGPSGPPLKAAQVPSFAGVGVGRGAVRSPERGFSPETGFYEEGPRRRFRSPTRVWSTENLCHAQHKALDPTTAPSLPRGQGRGLLGVSPPVLPPGDLPAPRAPPEPGAGWRRRPPLRPLPKPGPLEPAPRGSPPRPGVLLRVPGGHAALLSFIFKLIFIYAFATKIHFKVRRSSDPVSLTPTKPPPQFSPGLLSEKQFSPLGLAAARASLPTARPWPRPMAPPTPRPHCLTAPPLPHPPHCLTPAASQPFP